MLTIKNYQLVDLLEFLEKTALRPKASRVRSKLNRLLYAKIQDLQSDELALLERFGKKDENGKIIENDGAYTLLEATAAEYHRERRALMEESVSVNVDELGDKLRALMDELENSDITLSGKDAEVLDLLFDMLEIEVSAT